MSANDSRNKVKYDEMDTTILKIGGVNKTTALNATTGSNTGDNATNTTSNAYADAKVADNLTSSATVAPSKDAVNTGLGLKINSSEKGAASGVAPLDGSSKIASTYLPAIAITDTFVVASQVAMLALTAQTGDVAVRSDLNKSFILAGTNPTVLGDWQELLTPTNAVLSVNGQTGVVSISTITGNAGTATALATPRNINGVAFDGTANIEVVSTATQAATDKATPVDADTFSIFDSASSFVLKKLTWANLKATLKTYFDSLTTTFTNKRITPRVSTEASNVAPSIDADAVDSHIITALGGNMTTGLTWTGTPTSQQKLIISITPSGAVRNLVFVASKFEASFSQALPTVTFADGVRMDIGCIYNSATSKFRVLSVS